MIHTGSAGNLAWSAGIGKTFNLPRNMLRHKWPRRKAPYYKEEDDDNVREVSGPVTFAAMTVANSQLISIIVIRLAKRVVNIFLQELDALISAILFLVVDAAVKAYLYTLYFSLILQALPVPMGCQSCR